jgi:hypothetical protein
LIGERTYEICPASLVLAIFWGEKVRAGPGGRVRLEIGGREKVEELVPTGTGEAGAAMDAGPFRSGAATIGI